MDILSSPEPIDDGKPQPIDNGICESCPNEGARYKFIDIKMCWDCYSRELEFQKEIADPAKQAERLQAHKNIENIHLQHIREENAAIRISSDIFNAKIKSIQSLKEAIDADPTIENKNWALAQVLNERYVHLNDLLHGKRKEVAEAENEQRAIQTYYNDLSKKLRIEEREKLKLADLTYKPLPVPVKEKKEVKVKKYDKTGIAAAALMSGIQEALIQMVCVARDITPQAAVMILKEQGLGKK